jgi:hypothetical protein
MKFTPIIFALGLLLTGCSRHDAKLADQVAGTWMSAHTVWTLSPDGSFHSRLAGTNDNVIKEAIYDGTWSVQDGFLVTTITKRSSQNLTNPPPSRGCSRRAPTNSNHRQPPRHARKRKRRCNLEIGIAVFQSQRKHQASFPPAVRAAASKISAGRMKFHR